MLSTNTQNLQNREIRQQEHLVEGRRGSTEGPAGNLERIIPASTGSHKKVNASAAGRTWGRGSAAAPGPAAEKGSMQHEFANQRVHSIFISQIMQRRTWGRGGAAAQGPAAPRCRRPWGGSPGRGRRRVPAAPRPLACGGAATPRPRRRLRHEGRPRCRTGCWQC